MLVAKPIAEEMPYTVEGTLNCGQKQLTLLSIPSKAVPTVPIEVFVYFRYHVRHHIIRKLQQFPRVVSVPAAEQPSVTSERSLVLFVTDG
jgi:hypothetical protein